MRHPVDIVYITQKFAQNPATYKQFDMAGHNGIDYRTRFLSNAYSGKVEVKAAKEGEVIEVADQGKAGYGKFVRLRHEGSSQTIYGHNSELKVKRGQVVREGDVIAISGWTGFCIPADSRGAHVHFGYRPDGWEKIYNNGFKGYIDPLPIIEKQVLEKRVETYDMDFSKKWAGWLVIVPEKNGEVWYVSPKNLRRYRLNNFTPDVASGLARDGVWIGMTFADLSKIEEDKN